jgi:biopolymer transport protein TolQ
LTRIEIFYILIKTKIFSSLKGGALSGINLWAMGQLFPGSTGGGFRGSVVDLVLYSGPVVKIVLLILLFFSILSWAIIFSKLLLIRRADRESREFLRIFWEGKQLSSIFADSKKLRSSPTAEVFRAGYVELNKLSQGKPNPDSSKKVNDPTALNIELGGVDNINRAMRQATTSELTKLERALGFLATTGSTTPFIGLFGTVWGIMDAFRGIGMRGSATLAVVAPGISEALITTAAGLAAAIPAVVAYNYYINRIKVLSAEMENFSAELLNIVKRHFLKS